MSCTCPRCDQGGGECLYDEIERLKSTITRQAAALKMAMDELERITTAKPSEWEADMRDQFKQWAQNRATAALTACREALKGDKE